jgi:hypothetical protein
MQSSQGRAKEKNKQIIQRRGVKEGIKRNLAIDFYRQTQVKRQKQEGKKK